MGIGLGCPILRIDEGKVVWSQVFVAWLAEVHMAKKRGPFDISYHKILYDFRTGRRFLLGFPHQIG
jgi:hypothetical protein